MTTIPLLKPSCTQAEKDAVLAVLESSWWGQGPKVAQFEQAMASRYGYRHCVTTNSATAALHLALLSHGVGPGDEVIVPALTFVSTALAVSYCGARPVFADVDPETLCFDWDDIPNKRSKRTSAIIPVDYAGYPATEGPHFGNAWPIVQDAAHSCGGKGYGDTVCLSFHAVKNLASGDGGAILTDDAEQATRLRALRWCGIDRSTYERTATKGYGWDYNINEVGYKLHWNDLQAAIGLAQLGRLDAMNARRREIATRYTAELGGLVQTPCDHPAHTWHLYAIRVEAERRNGIIDYLTAHGVSAGVHYKPLTHYPMYADQPTPPVTEREWQRLISLPIYADMTDEDQERVIATLKEVL